MMPINQNAKKEDPKVQQKIDSLKEELQTTSSLASDKWIDAASKLVGKHNMEFSDIGLFDTEQLENILNAMENGDFTPEQIKSIMDINLNATQMSVILMGYANGGTVEQLRPYFTNSGIPYIKMNYMVTALVKYGVSMMPYIDFDPHQIYEIYAGIVQGLPYEMYANKHYPAEVMGLIRHALAIEGIDVKCGITDIKFDFSKLIGESDSTNDDTPVVMPNFEFTEDEDVEFVLNQTTD